MYQLIVKNNKGEYRQTCFNKHQLIRALGKALDEGFIHISITTPIIREFTLPPDEYTKL